MQITTVSTLNFTITSTPPADHETALNMAKLAAGRGACSITTRALPMDEGRVDSRRSIVEITCEEMDYLTDLSDRLKASYDLIGVEMT